MTTIEIAWVAGFLEGEGWFGVKGKSKVPTITVAQVQKEPIERFEKLFGGKATLYKKNNPKWKDVWFWNIFGARAAGLMMTLYILMSPKRQEQIRNALSHWKTQPPRMPRGYGLRNPNSPFYVGSSGRWK